MPRRLMMDLEPDPLEIRLRQKMMRGEPREQTSQPIRRPRTTERSRITRPRGIAKAVRRPDQGGHDEDVNGGKKGHRAHPRSALMGPDETPEREDRHSRQQNERR